MLLISVSTIEIRSSIQILEQRGLFLLAIIALIVMVLGYVLAGYLVKPFQKVTRSIEDLTDGYLEESISVP